MTPEEQLARFKNVEAGRVALQQLGIIPAAPTDADEPFQVATKPAPSKPAPRVVLPWAPVDSKLIPAPASTVCRVAPSLESSVLASTLSKDYGLGGAMVTGTLLGPTVTTYLVEIQKGTRASNVSSREKDLARDLGIGQVRILDNVGGYPGCIGVEVPNLVRGTVSFRDTLMALKPGTLKLPIVLGATATGRPLCLDLAGMPHLLVAGTTGSGKSIFLHSVICSLAATLSPDDLQIYLVDPKRVEFKEYKTLPHLLYKVMVKVLQQDGSYKMVEETRCRIAYEQDEALAMLKGMVTSMEKRYAMFDKLGVRDIREFNGHDFVQSDRSARMPYIVVVIDEFSDLMMAGDGRKEIETLIVRLAQKARAAGIHLVLATQRPAERVLTKDIRDNMPSRLAFRVADNAASRLILGERGAEDLLGKVDMLVSTETIPVTRVQGAHIDQDTIKAIVKLAGG